MSLLAFAQPEAALEDWLDRELEADRLLDPAELCLLAEGVGREERLWRPLARHVGHTRYAKLLHRRDVLDVWLLCWVDAQETGLHDHDRSAGAFYVCEGELVEDVIRCDESGLLRIAQRRAMPGTSTGFGGGHIHGVRNGDSRPATSIHVYSPALYAMGHYEADAGGGLRRDVRSYADEVLEP